MYNVSPQWEDFQVSICTYKGGVRDAESGKLLPNRTLAAYIQEQGTSFAFQTDSAGHFFLDVPPTSGKQTIQICDLFDQKILIEKQEKLPERDRLPIVPKQLGSEQLKMFVEDEGKRRKIRQYFHRRLYAQQDAIQEEKWEREPNVRIHPPDYEAFSTLREFLQSIATPLKIRGSRDTWTVRMVNPLDKPFFPATPVFYRGWSCPYG